MHANINRSQLVLLVSDIK